MEQVTVSEFLDYLPSLVSLLLHECDNFRAGRVSNFLPEWKSLTSDPDILSNVSGVKIECDFLPEQPARNKSHFNQTEFHIIQKEIETLISKGVLEATSPSAGQIISPIFLRPKPDGTHRMILNLKQFNQCVTYRHFKMDTLNTITNLMTPDCFMASLDLKDAYYSVYIAPEDRKYLRLEFNHQLLQYTALPNGLSSCPRTFTKILKPALSTLHKEGHIATAYIDDIYLQGDTFDECLKTVIKAIKLFTMLGFIIHPRKSAFIPSQEIKMLGFILNSKDMIVSPTQDKKDSTVALCSAVLQRKTHSIRNVAQVLGKIVACFPGALFGPLFYRHIDHDKTMALKQNKGNFDKDMILSFDAKTEIKWWIENLARVFRPLTRDHASMEIKTDASLQGWGAYCQNISTGGLWSFEEQQHHINYLEMYAMLGSILFTLVPRQLLLFKHNLPLISPA